MTGRESREPVIAHHQDGSRGRRGQL